MSARPGNARRAAREPAGGAGAVAARWDCAGAPAARCSPCWAAPSCRWPPPRAACRRSWPAWHWPPARSPTRPRRRFSQGTHPGSRPVRRGPRDPEAARARAGPCGAAGVASRAPGPVRCGTTGSLSPSGSGRESAPGSAAPRASSPGHQGLPGTAPREAPRFPEATRKRAAPHRAAGITSRAPGPARCSGTESLPPSGGSSGARRAPRSRPPGPARCGTTGSLPRSRGSTPGPAAPRSRTPGPARWAGSHRPPRRHGNPFQPASRSCQGLPARVGAPMKAASRPGRCHIGGARAGTEATSRLSRPQGAGEARRRAASSGTPVLCRHRPDHAEADEPPLVKG